MRLTIRNSGTLDDWYAIERSEHDGREWEESRDGVTHLMDSAMFCDAQIEGTARQMLGIAAAIEIRGSQFFDRCAVIVDGNRVFFENPRNSKRQGECSLAEADALAIEIRAMLSPLSRRDVPTDTEIDALLARLDAANEAGHVFGAYALARRLQYS